MNQSSPKTLILGPIGCGDFSNDPKIIASYFCEFIQHMSPYYSRILFAIPSSYNANNYDSFQQELLKHASLWYRNPMMKKRLYFTLHICCKFWIGMERETVSLCNQDPFQTVISEVVKQHLGKDHSHLKFAIVKKDDKNHKFKEWSNTPSIKLIDALQLAGLSMQQLDIVCLYFFTDPN